MIGTIKSLKVLESRFESSEKLEAESLSEQTAILLSGAVQQEPLHLTGSII